MRKGVAGWRYRAGYFAMALFYVAAGVNHFWNPAIYVKIMPPYLPWPLALVYASGVAEIFGGLGLLIPLTRALASWGIIAMLIVFLRVHFYMCLFPERFPGIPVWVLWVRIPLQGVLIAWAWYYTQRVIAQP